jgi:hypothetical protein
MRSKSEPWFTVCCLFSHPTRANDGDGHLYEERVTLWRSESWDEAYRLARIEALRYAEEADAIFIDTTDACNLFDPECGHGTEVWSVMRGSHFDARTYTNTFCTTQRDCGHEYIGPE